MSATCCTVRIFGACPATGLGVGCALRSALLFIPLLLWCHCSTGSHYYWTSVADKWYIPSVYDKGVMRNELSWTQQQENIKAAKVFAAFLDLRADEIEEFRRKHPDF